ncbi:MAG: primosomal protein N' [Proteobacteria bacterium]|nr:primosomal protein N' [Pseudomonadota bacterium]
MELEIAIPNPLGQTFTYFHPSAVEAGTRVKVPFASQGKTLGVVLKCSPDDPHSSRKFKLRPVSEVVDQEPVYSAVMLELASWMSQYYLHPIGEVLRTMLPASKTRSRKETFVLTIDKPNPESTSTSEKTPEISSTIDLANPELHLDVFGKKRSMGKLTIQQKLKKKGLIGKQQEALFRKWQQLKIVELKIDADFKARSSISQGVNESQNSPVHRQLISPKLLNSAQMNAVASIVEKGIHTPPKEPFLLFGVTGSGKTEVFMTILEQLISKNSEAQSLILVPEISLTPQTTRIFKDRFPGVVAVVHSAMDDDDRWSELHRIRLGLAKILIGPRSAVFGPFKNLKLIVVDEEHDSSYKQGSGLLYNARDLAVMRGKLENAAVVLGSATPSMESWFNAKMGRYQLIELPERATKRPLPEIKTVLSKPSNKAIERVRLKPTDAQQPNPDEQIFSSEVIDELRSNLVHKQQSIVLVNRRGYAFYLLNLQDGKTAQCPNCSISLSVHGRRNVLRCHYCDYKTSMQRILDESKTDTWAIVGHGSQKAEDSLRALLPDARIARLDSDTVADPKALPEILEQFRSGQLDILVGTQILAKGHDFPNVTLICILEVDQLLGLPDFRGGERTFQLLVQAAGRAGRGELPGRVIVQSMRIENAVVKDALKQDYVSFANQEMLFRKSMGYPPFGKMTLFEFNGTDPVKLDQWCAKLDADLDQKLQATSDLLPHIKILGPAPSPIEVIRGRTRRTLIVLGDSFKSTRAASQMILDSCKNPPGDIRFKVDVDPQSTL